MRRGLATSALGVCLLSAFPGLATDYYVATNGDDGHPGTLAEPFATIQHAANVAAAGDTVHIRGGSYHEVVTISGLDGTAANPVTFTNYGDEEVVIKGTLPITSSWSVHSGSIHKTTIGRDIWQLFVDGRVHIPARWPNITSVYWDAPDDSSGWDPTPGSYWDRDDWIEDGNGTWARATAVTASNVTNDDAAHDLGGAGVSFEGAVMVGTRIYASGQDIFHETITSHAAGSQSFQHSTTYYQADAVQKHSPEEARYYVVGDLDALDSPGEWFYEAATGDLYVWFFDSGSPSGRSIEGRTEGHILKLWNSSHLQFSGLWFFSGATYLDGTTHTRFDECKFSYPSATKVMLGELSHLKPPAKNETYNANPADLSWTNSWFEYAEGRALALRTWDNLIENCYFRNNAWGPTTFGVVSDKKGGNTTYRRLTIESTGRSNGSKTGPGATIEYSRYEKFYFRGDSSGFQIPSGGASTTVLHHNWNIDAFNRNGVRFDGDPAGEYGRIHHSVSLRANKGFRLKGDHHEIANLTGIGCDDNDLNIAFTKGGNANTVSANLAGQKVFDVSGTNSTSWFGLAEGGQLEEQLRDPHNLDFRPRAGSSLVDAGTIWAPYTDGYVGSAPDIGAYEYGDSSYWIPGYRFERASTPIPPSGTTDAKLDADLMWLEGREATSHEVYFGTDAAAVANATMASPEYAGSQSNNIFSPGGLDADTVYYWRIDESTPSGMIPGEVWSLHTIGTDSGGGPAATPATDDSYTVSGNPGSNYGLDSHINLKGDRIGWVQFDVSGITGTVTSAGVRFRTKPDPGRLPLGPTLYAVDENGWDELSLTHENAPVLGAAIETLSGPFVASSWIEFDVTAQGIADGVHSFAITDPGTHKVRLETKESDPAFSPQLVIEHDGGAANNGPHWDEVSFQKQDATVDLPYGDEIASLAYDLDGDALTFSRILGPTWLEVAADGAISGTPGPADLGQNHWTVRVQDDGGAFEDAQMRLTVAGSSGNAPPTFAADPFDEIDATEGQPYSATLADDATDPDFDPLTFSKISGPEWLVVAADGALSGTPSAGDVGEHSSTVECDDGNGGTDQATLEIRVAPASGNPPAGGPLSIPALAPVALAALVLGMVALGTLAARPKSGYR